MTREAIADRFDAVLVQVLGVAPGLITPDFGPERSSAWDSAAQLRLVFATEEAFGITWSLAQIEGLTDREAFIVAIGHQMATSPETGR